MLIYKDVIKKYKTQELIKQITYLTDKMNSVSSSVLYSNAAELLLRYGEFESAVTDSLSSGEDIYSGFTAGLRTAGELTGAIYTSVINNEQPSPGISASFNELFSRRIFPASLNISVPEGYAFYSLYPEMYIDAAMKFVNSYQAGHVVVIGIRGIGCSLASVVSAVLRQNGWNARSFTVRPRGEYFNRKLCVSLELKQELLKIPGAKYLIADEGPGLSGSSFSSVAGYLSSNGIPDNDIIFFPSWDADGSTFVSEESRIRWQRHKKIFVSFEESVIESGKLKRAFGYDSIQDISAGKWRSLFFEDNKNYPHTFAGAEQRKYLISRDGEKSILKFSGLGHYGLKLFERAKILQEAGFSPRTGKTDYGFIEFEFLKGKQLAVKQKSAKLTDRLAEYIAFTGRNFPEAPAMDTDELKEMIRINIEKGLGKKWTMMLKRNMFLRDSDYLERSAAIDGRMLPFEWISVNGVYMKTDSLQHHISHFIPGSADIAWDLAGAIIEFRLGGSKSGKHLTSTYIDLSGDLNITKRLPFYIAAYAAFRLGYTEFAAERSGDIQEMRKLKYQSNYYKSILREILSRP
ncbi:MAG: hypothetical protein ACM3Q2_16015 [Syntrophothermus sp.]